ncbi:MAG TPA: hypothetical protein VH815_01490 [Acidobacteriota bacterium]
MSVANVSKNSAQRISRTDVDSNEREPKKIHFRRILLVVKKGEVLRTHTDNKAM